MAAQDGTLILSLKNRELTTLLNVSLMIANQPAYLRWLMHTWAKLYVQRVVQRVV